MAHNIIEGINTVIKGLEMIKVELVSKGAQEDMAVKVANILAGGAVQEDKVTVKAEKQPKAKAEPKVEATPVEDTPDESADVEVAGDRKAELDAMSYNEIKALASSLGAKAVGNKAKLIDVILELEAQGAVEEDGEDAEDESTQADEPASEKADTGKGEGNAKKSSTKPAKEEVVEEEDDEDDEEEDSEEDTEEFREFLDDLSLEEVEEIADELGIEFGAELKKKDRKKVTEKCLANVDKLTAVLEELGYYDDAEEDEEEADEEVEEDDSEDDETDYADELGLNDMSVDELADILAEHDLSTKGKKQALIDRIVKAVEDGTIEIDDEEEEEEEAPAPKKGGKKGSKK